MFRNEHLALSKFVWSRYTVLMIIVPHVKEQTVYSDFMFICTFQNEGHQNVFKVEMEDLGNGKIYYHYYCYHCNRGPCN